MGLVISRLNFIETSDSARQRSQQDETTYTFYNQTTQSLNKKFFSNYFLMAGEKFDVDDPDYLFGDEYDLNFLSCSKPYYLPYKQARQNLLTLLNTTQKAIGRANRFRSPFYKFTSRNNSSLSNSSTRKQQQQDDDNNNSKKLPKSPSKPLVMFVNIRKETLRLVIDCSPQEADETSGGETSSQLANTNNNKVYNIQFDFDSDVDCSIRIFYFCTREITPNGINYKPQHATYKSKMYYYKKGLEQKFNQPEHTFQPHLFDEDLLMYKPLDTNGNYNSGAVFPLVIHCVALNGPSQKQSYSLVATIEKSQLDESYSIKPLKQLIFVDGVQYILQDIYGIEHKQSITNAITNSTTGCTAIGTSSCINNHTLTTRMRQQKYQTTKETNLSIMKSHSLPLSLNISNLNLDDNGSITSINLGSNSNTTNPNRQNRESSIRHKSLTNENAYECVICMSEERDTMLLPCRHLCLCGSCAQSLRYQASSCPICRCTFKAALNLRPSNSSTAQQRPSNSGQSSANATSKV